MEHLTSAATLIMVNLPYSNFEFNEEALKGDSSYRLDDEKAEICSIIGCMTF